MKKSTFAKIALSASVIPCALLMTACGGTQLDRMASVDTKGATYKTSSIEAVNTYLDQEEVVTSLPETAGYHVSMKTQGGMFGSMFVNAYVLVDEDGVATESAIKVEMKLGDDEINMKAWVKEGVMYTEMTVGGQPLKTKATLPTGYDAEYALEEAGENIMLDAMDYLNMLEGVAGTEIGTFKVEMSETDTTTSFHVASTESYSLTVGGTTSTYDKVDCYVVFEDGQFKGASLEMDGKSGEDEMTGYMAVTTFDGKIRYPDFSEFTIGY